MSQLLLTEAHVRVEHIPAHQYIGIWDIDAADYMKKSFDICCTFPFLVKVYPYKACWKIFPSDCGSVLTASSVRTLSHFPLCRL